MASYAELVDLFAGTPESDLLKKKVFVSAAIAANGLLTGTPTVEQQKWASSVFSEPKTEGSKAFIGVIVSNSDLTIAQILAAGDAAIQTEVDAIVPSLVIAFNA